MIRSVVWPGVAQRASVNRTGGIVELNPFTMTREISRKMLVDDVIPAILVSRSSYFVQLQLF